MRYKDRQEQAADFRDTKLSKPDSGSAEATQAGVSNTHAYGELAGQSYAQIGEGVAKGIKNVSDFKEGYDLAKIDQEHAANINEYLYDPTTAPQEDLDVATNTEERMWANAANDNAEGKGQQIVDTINIASANTAKAITRLATAKKQGRMSAEQFVANSTRITREAIARHPSLSDEILGNTRKLWAIAGVQDQLDLDKAAKQSQLTEMNQVKANERTSYLSWNKGLPYTENGEVDYELMRQRNNKQNEIVHSLEEAKRLIEDKSIESTLKAEKLLAPKEDGTDSVIEVTRAEGEKQLIKSTHAGFKAAGDDAVLIAAELTKLKENIRGMKETYFKETEDMHGVPRMLRFHTEAGARLDLIAQDFIDVKSGTTVRAALETSARTAQHLANKELQILYGMHPTMQNALNEMIKTVGVGTLIAKDPELFSKYVRQIGKIMDKNTDVQDSVLANTPVAAKSLDAIATSAISRLDGDMSDEDRKITTTAANRTVMQQARTFKQSGTGVEGVARLDKLTESYASAEFTNAGKHLNDESKAAATKILSGALGIYQSNMVRDLQRWRSNGAQVNVSYENGNLSFTGDSGAVRALTAKLSNRVRATRKALANINGYEMNSAKIDKIFDANMPVLGLETEQTDQVGRDRSVKQRALYNSKDNPTPPKKVSTALANEQKSLYNTYEDTEKKKIPLRTL